MRDDSAPCDLVALGRLTLEAQNARDIDALIALYAADAVWDARGPDLAGERFEGSAAIRAFFEEWLGAFDDMRLEAVEVRAAGDGVLFSHFVQHGKPHGSSASIAFPFATVSIWVDGLIRENSIYADIDQARAAAERLAADRARPAHGETPR